MIKTLIFDLDGTLVNTLYDLADACNRALIFYKMKPHPTDDYRYFIGQGVKELARKMLPKELKDDEDWIARIIKKQTEIYAKIYKQRSKLYPYANVTLKQLNKLEIKLFVFSNKLDKYTKLMVKEMLPEVKFEAVVGLSDKYPRKPDPSAIIAVFKKKKLSFENSAFVGDSKVDCETATNLKITMIGCNYGFRGKKELVDNGAKYTIDNLKELIKIVKKENKLILPKSSKK